MDLYSMLGNALDNAIKGVRGFEEKEKRLINVLIRNESKLLLIHIINPAAGQLSFRDGLPSSTKTNDGYHGFGLKSIRYYALILTCIATIFASFMVIGMRVFDAVTDPIIGALIE